METIKKWLLFLWKWIKIAIIFYFVSTILTVIIYRFVDPPVTPLMVIRSVENWFDDKDASIKKEWIDIDDISPNAYRAVIASEDQLFLEHYGFDVNAISKAYEGNQKGRKIKGASTISQQTAKNVFLWPGRSWIRKGFETYFTALIELFWSKKRIMEVYLNVIETGDGIYGYEKASQIYFNTSSSKINKGQAATVAALLPSPIRYSKVRNGEYIAARKRWIMYQMGYFAEVKF